MRRRDHRHIPPDLASTGERALRVAERHIQQPSQVRGERDWIHPETNRVAMKSTCLLIVTSLVICNLAVCGAQQGLGDEHEADGLTVDDIILQRAEGLLLRSMLKKMQKNEDSRAEESQMGWMTKRQHPGKRLSDGDHHPGRRDERRDEKYLMKDHPTHSEEDMLSYMMLPKRQHPGKRTVMELVSENPALVLSRLSKRQHPGKRYLGLQSKRQHPGKRYVGEGEEEEEDGDRDWDADTAGEEDYTGFEKRQHPGKRFWDNSNPELDTNIPCDGLDPVNCSKTNLLLDFLESINKSHVEEKRQHPGKRSASEEDLI